MKHAKHLIVIVASFLLLSTACSKEKSGGANQESQQSRQPAKTATAASLNLSPYALKGKKIATHNGCMNCHTTNGKTLAGPTFQNLYGHKVTLQNGSTIIADSSYIIQSLKYPSKKITAGFSPIMPDYSFLTDQQMKHLIAYLKSFSNADLSD